MRNNRVAKTTERKFVIYLVVGLMWSFSSSCPSALAGEKVAGRGLFLVTPYTTIPVGTDDDHVLRYAAERGTQMEYTGVDWLKGCSLLRTGTCDLTGGRGACFGYQIWVAPNGDRLVAKYSGVMLPDDKGEKKPPDTIVRGTWVYVKGSGQFANIVGAGVYRGRYTSAGEYELEWSGEAERRAPVEATQSVNEAR
jgi:hypothetical protein